MVHQYFGIKELYEVCLRAKTAMTFGERQIEADEPVLYFDNVSMSMLSEQSREIYARGGWLNQPKVIWQDRSEIRFQMSQGVVSQFGFGILLGAKVAVKGIDKPILMHKTEGPFDPSDTGLIYLENWPVNSSEKKTFIFDYARDAVQKKIYGKRISGKSDGFGGERPCIQLYEDKELKTLADTNRKYIVDYYYKYGKETISYTLQKERFNGLFSLEGKFYSKDENEGQNYTNILYMPKVRIVSDINLRLGERADPAVSAFDIIGLPETVGDDKDLIVEIQHLSEDLDADI